MQAGQWCGMVPHGPHVLEHAGAGTSGQQLEIILLPEQVRKKAVMALHRFEQLDPMHEGPLSGADIDAHLRRMLCDKVDVCSDAYAPLPCVQSLRHLDGKQTHTASPTSCFGYWRASLRGLLRTYKCAF
jgi:hypothetical protein